MKRAGGFTFLEILVVLLLMTALFKTLYGFTVQKVEEGNYRLLEINVTHVQDALEAYARASCNELTQINPTISILLSNDFLPKDTDAINPFTNNDLEVSVDWNKPINVFVSATMKSPGQAQAVFNKLRGTTITGSRVTWQRAMTIINNNLAASHMFSKMYEDDCQ